MKQGIIRNISSIVFLLILFSSKAQIPDGYYDGTADLKGQELKIRLHRIIRGHTVRSYSEFRDTILPDLDEDPNNSDNIILFYKNNSIPKSDFAVNGDSWNREHTWPSSHGFPNTSDTTYTDAHNLRPSDASVNSSKSNKDFGDLENTSENIQGEAPDTYTNSDLWEPRDEIKGDVARILFYMSTRYENEQLDLELVDRISFSGDPELGVLFTLIRWHEQDPVDDTERARHEGVFGYQGNRNPYVDHPEFVSDIFGSATDPTLVVDELNFNRDFGFVELGSSLSQSYTITAYNLSDDVSVKVESPFSLSSDEVTWADSIGFSNDNSGEQQFTVFLRFSPDSEDQEASATVINFTDEDSVEINVVGKEGEQEFTTIAEARSKSLGDVVSVSGIVIDQGNNSSNSRFIYDGTAGIVVRSFDSGNESSNLTQGDSITVSGGLSEFNNLLQIEESPIVINILKQNATLPTPQLVTIPEVGEDLEAELIRVENVSFKESGNFAGGGGDGNFTITDGTNELVFRIGSSSHPLAGTAIPTGLFNITGFVGQFGSDYQLSVRSMDDLESVSGNGEIPDLMTIAQARVINVGNKTHVTGVVIGGENNSGDNRIIYDGTAGIVVRSFDEDNASAQLVLGDSVIVTGGMTEFNGVLQIEESPVTIELISQNATLPIPQTIKLEDISEDYESELIKVENVDIMESGSFERSDYTINDEATSLILRIGSSSHPLVGESIPETNVSLTGYIGQFGTDYQLFLRNENDIEIIEDALGLQVRESNNMVYPNPVKTSFQIRRPDSSINELIDLVIFDVNGKIVRRLEQQSQFYSVNELENGMYILVANYSGQAFYSRLIVRH
ncbi:MAG: endonuclease [Ekhidna sp.]